MIRCATKVIEGGSKALLLACVCAMAALTTSASAQDPIPGRGAPPSVPAPKPSERDGFSLRSAAFADSTRIPDRFTVEGEDLSPPLTWGNAPPETKSFAIICEDIDLRNRPFVHWVIYGISPDVQQLPEGLPRERELTEPIAAKQGTCSFPKDNVGYRGPATPRGAMPHRYRFTLYALKAIPEVRPGLNAETLRNRMKDLILAEATLVGTYSRARRPGETPPGVQEPEVVPGAPSAPPAAPPAGGGSPN